MKKIVVTQDVGLSLDQKNCLSSLGEVIFFDSVPNSSQEWLDRVQGADIIYSEEAQMHESLPYINNCFITFPFTSFLREVDIDQLKQHKVVSAGAKGGNKYAVAEWNVMALFNLTRHITKIGQSTEKLGWDFLSSIKGVRGLSVLILGKGNIGTVTGEMCQALGMNVDYYKRGDDLTNKIKGKEVIINCLTLSDETHELINKKSLFGFGGYYITSTRAEIHNIHDLIELIKTNAIKGFADDCASIPGADVKSVVFKNLKESLQEFNVFITPHIAWSTTNAIEYSNDVCIENIKQYLLGTPVNVLY